MDRARIGREALLAVIVTLVVIGLGLVAYRSHCTALLVRQALVAQRNRVMVVGSGSNICGAFKIVLGISGPDVAFYHAYRDVGVADSGSLRATGVRTSMCWSSCSRIGTRSAAIVFCERGEPSIHLGECSLLWSAPAYVYPYGAQSVHGSDLWVYASTVENVEEVSRADIYSALDRGEGYRVRGVQQTGAVSWGPEVDPRKAVTDLVEPSRRSEMLTLLP